MNPINDLFNNLDVAIFRGLFSDSMPRSILKSFWQELRIQLMVHSLRIMKSIFAVSLGPSPSSDIPGQMCFLTYDLGPPNLVVMHSISGSHDAPVFLFNGEAVPVETDSFGSVKVLYR